LIVASNLANPKQPGPRSLPASGLPASRPRRSVPMRAVLCSGIRRPRAAAPRTAAHQCSSTMAAASSASRCRTTPLPDKPPSSGMLALVQATGFVDAHLPPSPAAFESCCNWACKSLVPFAVQDGRGAPSAGYCGKQRRGARMRASGYPLSSE